MALSCLAPKTISAAPLVVRALDFHPVDVSADGSVVVGFKDRGGFDRVRKAIVWHPATGVRQEIDLIPSFPERVGDPDARAPYESFASSISADGSVVVGEARPLYEENFYPKTEGFRWTATTGTVSLGTTVGGKEMWSAATGVSADGSVVVGNSVGLSARSYVAFRWTADTGMTYLPDMRFASAVSDDGGTVVGAFQGSPRTDPARWTAEKGTIRLEGLPQHFGSRATDVSADGSVVTGVSIQFSDSGDTLGPRLFRWTTADGMTDLGWGSGGSMSADGAIIVGNWGGPFVWDEAHGKRSLSDALTELGVDLGGWDLGEVGRVSGDGHTFIGYGHDPSGNASGWIVTVPEPAGLLPVVLLAPALLRRHGRRRLTHSATH